MGRGFRRPGIVVVAAVPERTVTAVGIRSVIHFTGARPAAFAAWRRIAAVSGSEALRAAAAGAVRGSRAAAKNIVPQAMRTAAAAAAERAVERAVESPRPAVGPFFASAVSQCPLAKRKTASSAVSVAKDFSDLRRYGSAERVCEWKQRKKIK